MAQPLHQQQGRDPQNAGQAMSDDSGDEHSRDEGDRFHDSTGIKTKFSFSLIPLTEAQQIHSSLTDEAGENCQSRSSTPLVSPLSSYGSQHRLTNDAVIPARPAELPAEVPTQPRRAHLPTTKTGLFKPLTRLFRRPFAAHKMPPVPTEGLSVECTVELAPLAPLAPLSTLAPHPTHRHTHYDHLHEAQNNHKEADEFPPGQGNTGLNEFGGLDYDIEANRAPELAAGHPFTELDLHTEENINPAQPRTPAACRIASTLPVPRSAPLNCQTQAHNEYQLLIARAQSRVDCRVACNRAKSRPSGAGTQSLAHSRLLHTTGTITRSSPSDASKTAGTNTHLYHTQRGLQYIPTTNPRAIRVESPHLVPSRTPFAQSSADRLRMHIFHAVLVVMLFLPVITVLVHTTLMSWVIRSMTYGQLSRFTPRQECLLRRVGWFQVVLLLGAFVWLVWWEAKEVLEM